MEPITREGIRPEAPFYNPDSPRWWVSSRQRVVVLTFIDATEADDWDEHPTLDALIEINPDFHAVRAAS